MLGPTWLTVNVDVATDEFCSFDENRISVRFQPREQISQHSMKAVISRALRGNEDGANVVNFTVNTTVVAGMGTAFGVYYRDGMVAVLKVTPPWRSCDTRMHAQA